eukprot:TRINITY_DN16311_c0_g1_i1.p1 TRINITY_DN16311_c0_g1~~TRINITY_DN16311_c0_g1_i1.p1  ORF type:complete len:291 (-),score=37.22 TRINITY_DN16311_c0_g1_i1:270-1142(-)
MSNITAYEILRLGANIVQDLLYGVCASTSPVNAYQVYKVWARSRSGRIHQCFSRVGRLAAIVIGFELVSIFLLRLFTIQMLQSLLTVVWAIAWTVPSSFLHTLLTSFWIKELPLPHATNEGGEGSSTKTPSAEVKEPLTRQLAKMVLNTLLPLLLPAIAFIFQNIPFIGVFISPFVNSYIIGYYAVDILFSKRMGPQDRAMWIEKRWAYLSGMALPACLSALFLPYTIAVVFTNCWWLYITLLLFATGGANVRKAPMRLPVFKWTGSGIDWIILSFKKLIDQRLSNSKST